MEQFFEDYLERLQGLHRDFAATFEDLPPEALDWSPGADMNSFCVLVVHTTGASRFLIGDLALSDPSHRDRIAEFQARGLSCDELKIRFAALETYAAAACQRLTLADLAAERSFTNSRGRTMEITAGWALLHALEHTGLHLGHAQIARQLWERR